MTFFGAVQWYLQENVARETFDDIATFVLLLRAVRVLSLHTMRLSTCAIVKRIVGFSPQYEIPYANCKSSGAASADRY